MPAKSYIALLRGVNVGGHKKLPMKNLRNSCERIGLGNVVTYLQSGNLVFNSEIEDCSVLQRVITAIIRADFGFEIPVLVKEVIAFKQIFSDNPFTKESDLKNGLVYFTFLQLPISVDDSIKLKQENYPNELFKMTTNCVYLKCNNGYGKAKLTTNEIEKKLKNLATTRNYKTVKKLIELAS